MQLFSLFKNKFNPCCLRNWIIAYACCLFILLVFTHPFWKASLITILFVYFQLSEVFEAEIDTVMQSLGYCCGHKYVFCPQVLCCYGKQLCTIPRDAMYYSYQNRFDRKFCCVMLFKILHVLKHSFRINAKVFIHWYVFDHIVCIMVERVLKT